MRPKTIGDIATRKTAHEYSIHPLIQLPQNLIKGTTFRRILHPHLVQGIPTNRLTTIFLLQDSKYEGLIEQLDKYSKQGIPKSQYYQQGTDDALDALYKLEEDWRDIVEYKGNLLVFVLLIYMCA